MEMELSWNLSITRYLLITASHDLELQLQRNYGFLDPENMTVLTLKGCGDRPKAFNTQPVTYLRYTVFPLYIA